MSTPIPTEKPSASDSFIPETDSLASLQYAASACQGCDLHQRATQVVFGEGPRSARLMLIGEQPGDQEDRAGKPFVGPAGRLLDRVLAEVGLDRGEVYVTNAVKHFKWEPRGERRIHVKPSASEVQACRGWLRAELSAVAPTMIVCLGAVAAQSFLGHTFRVTTDHGRLLAHTPWAPWLMATYHPSALLRMPDEVSRAAALAHFIADMQHAADTLARSKASRAS
jgi:uracil-DNA glycosylase family protein